MEQENAKVGSNRGSATRKSLNQPRSNPVRVAPDFTLKSTPDQNHS